MHFLAMSEGKRSFYTAPIKALVNEKFFALCRDFGPENVGMITGDAAVNRDAPIICCTAEILSNMALREGNAAPVDCVIMDEFHYYSDRDRGVAWQVPLLLLERVQMLLMSATLGPTEFFEKELLRRTRRTAVTVRSAQRPVPLEFEYRESPLHETIADLVSKDRSPVYLVNFTQRSVAETAQDLMSQDFISKDKKRTIQEALIRVRFDTPVRQGDEALPVARHRPAPRGAAPQVPSARREARAAGPAGGHQRHRHAGRRREHSAPHRALHAPLQVRRREDGHPERARLPADRRGARAAAASTIGATWWRRRPSTSSRTASSRRRPVAIR